jgi:flavin reductase (DIM6/NTAB) family NADH-FMN oxidoreductase RutF
MPRVDNLLIVDNSVDKPFKTVTIKPSILYFGTPVALITTLNADGAANISAMSSLWALGDRVILGLGADGQCVRNLRRDRECVINLPDGSLWRQVERIAPTTGRQDVPEYKRTQGYRFEADKFARGGFSSIPSEIVKPPRIAECPLQLEAGVLEIHQPASLDGTDPGFVIVEARVLRVHAHTNIVIPETDHVDTSRWNPLLYVFRHYFSNARDLGQNFRGEA